MEGAEEEGEREILESFLPQYYGRALDIPDEILLSTEVDQLDLLRGFAEEKERQEGYSLHTSYRGEEETGRDKDL